MEKSKLMKVFLIIVLTMALALSTVNVFAADGQDLLDVTGDVQNGNSNSGNTNAGNSNGNSNSNSGNTNTGNRNGNSNSGSINNANRNGNSNSNANKNNNAGNGSTYNNNNLPKTGIAESGLMTCGIFVLVLSALYAFKKIRDYNNI